MILQWTAQGIQNENYIDKILECPDAGSFTLEIIKNTECPQIIRSYVPEITMFVWHSIFSCGIFCIPGAACWSLVSFSGKATVVSKSWFYCSSCVVRGKPFTELVKAAFVHKRLHHTSHWSDRTFSRPLLYRVSRRLGFSNQTFKRSSI